MRRARRSKRSMHSSPTRDQTKEVAEAMPFEPDHDAGVYGISVASELTGVAPQTLRLYEARGLLEPERTDGGTRRYSRRDLERVAQIAAWTAEGVTLAGIKRL